MKSFKWVSIMGLCLSIWFFSLGVKAEKKPVTITVWDWWVVQSKFLNNEISLFEKENPHIKIKRTITANNRYTTLVEMAERGDSMADIIAIDGGKFYEWVKAGFFHPITKWTGPAFIKRYPRGAFLPGVNTYKGDIYTFPVNGLSYWCQFYLNRDVFRKAGLVDKSGKVLYPKTWSDVRKYARTITEKGKGDYYGFGICARPDGMVACFFYEWARVAGARNADGSTGFLLDVDLKTGRFDFTDPAYMKMFKFLLDITADGSVYPGYLSMEDEILRAAFADGKIGMIMGGIWNQQGWSGTHKNFTEYDCLMIPPYDSTGYKAFSDTSVAGSYYAMSSDTKHPEEAWKFLEWFTKIDTGIRYVEMGQGPSIFEEANRKAKIKTPQMRQYIELSAKYAKQHPSAVLRNPELAFVSFKQPMPNSVGVFWGILSRQIPEKEIPGALKDMQDRYNKALDEAFAKAIADGYKVSLGDLIFPDWNPLEHYETKPGR
ncbi:MAG: ABC transporter substrate-binding protein [Bacillota bacterium]